MDKPLTVRCRRILSHLFRLLVLGFCLSTQGWSQETASQTPPVAPTGPLLKPAPLFSQWLITFSYPQDRSGNKTPVSGNSVESRLPRKILTTKTQNIIREETLKISGDKVDRWQVGQTFYIKPPTVNFWAMYDKDYQKNYHTEDLDRQSLPESGFRGVDWINAQTYAGTITTNEVSYLVFVPSDAAKPDVNDAKALLALPAIAYVDEVTRLPAMIRTMNVARTYTFLPPPTAVQALPPDLAADIKAADAIRAKFNVAPKKEY